MKRLVINRDFGGFSVSRDALHWLRQKGYQPAIDEIDIGEPWNAEEDPTDVRKPYLDGFLDHDNPRDDALLVQCIEELGEKANGPHAKLGIVEIPDDIQYQIEEYDGRECVAEVHRKWY